MAEWDVPKARAAATVNVTIANPATAVFDGVTLIAGQRVFLQAQSTGSENGLYTFNGSALALTRTSDRLVSGMLIGVTEGTANADSLWFMTTDTFTVGVTSLAWQKIGTGGGSQFTGTIGDGSTTSIPVTHGLGKQYVSVQLVDAGTNVPVIPNTITFTSTTVVTLGFSVAPTSAQYRVVVQ